MRKLKYQVTKTWLGTLTSLIAERKQSIEETSTGSDATDYKHEY